MPRALRPPSPTDSGSDSDAPEAVSLSQSKKSIQQQNAGIRQAQVLAQQKTKLKNREKDQKLKERAAKNKNDDQVLLKKRGEKKVVVEDPEGGDEVIGGVEARTLRAMKDAQVEDDDEDDEDFDEFREGSSFDGAFMDEDEDASGGSDDDEEGSNSDEAMESQISEDEAEADSDSDVEPESQPKKSNYLPDEIFKAAFSQTAKPKAAKKDILSKKQQKKRKRTSTPKDVIVGSKAIRTLASTARPISSNAAVPSSKIKKFLDRTLALKGQTMRGKSWERRPANIGVLRRNGPPAHFVRNR
ncbi:hypothetical protein P691DRAFT_799125 [Macrolepiota fuliginosa MF-IS2]|uniref:Uncharacterized protein n=1 Tax=Macrolepiota fuliginosa MF-IS2 TaxID=1400762 RepID=A0A9P6C2I7_9AGAR|nr:hypothetical protein P691DRAFT_799125 [Macrolepiota fuliginosa MF-IS2]